jgi:hypothetical protein
MREPTHDADERFREAMQSLQAMSKAMTEIYVVFRASAATTASELGRPVKPPRASQSGD